MSRAARMNLALEVKQLAGRAIEARKDGRVKEFPSIWAQFEEKLNELRDEPETNTPAFTGRYARAEQVRAEMNARSEAYCDQLRALGYDVDDLRRQTVSGNN